MYKAAIQSKVIMLSLALILLLSWPINARKEASEAQTNPSANIQNKALHSTTQMTDIHDIKPIETIGFNPVILWYFALGAVLLLLLAIVFVYWKKRQKKKVLEFVATVSPEEAALNLLDTLPPLMNSDGKQFYFELSMILRGYIEQRFAIGAPEMTTEELLSRIPELEIEKGMTRGVREFAHASDPVKFADQPAEIEKMKHHLEFVRLFIEKTTPISTNDVEELNSKPVTRNS